MADSRRKESQSNDQDKIAAHKEFLEKFNIRQQTRDALLKLIENRPENPLLFLAEYFDTISAESKTDKIANASRILSLSHHSSPAFNSNVVQAYDTLSAPKNPNSKKLANKRVGMIGSVHEEFLNSICYNVPEELRAKMIDKISCKWNEMVPFAVFKYSVTVALVLQDFLALSEDLFKVLSGKSEMAQRYLCDATIENFKASLRCNKTGNALSVMEAGRKLRPDALAVAILQAKEDEGDAKNYMEMHDFINYMALLYLDNVKALR